MGNERGGKGKETFKTYKTVALFIRHVRLQPSRECLLKDIHLAPPRRFEQPASQSDSFGWQVVCGRWRRRRCC